MTQHLLLIMVAFVYFARTEGRFAKQFDKEGKPSATLLSAQQDRLENWHKLRGEYFTQFFRDPTAGEVSHRVAYIRNNGLLNGEPSFTIISNRCAHLGCPVQANGPLDEKNKKQFGVWMVEAIHAQLPGTTAMSLATHVVAVEMLLACQAIDLLARAESPAVRSRARRAHRDRAAR